MQFCLLEPEPAAQLSADPLSVSQGLAEEAVDQDKRAQPKAWPIRSSPVIKYGCGK